MTTVSARICIVTSAPVSQNPRVVKEADALVEAGHDVRVCFARDAEWTRPLDEAITTRSRWRSTCIEISQDRVGARALRYRTGFRVRAGRSLMRATMRYPVPELAYSRYFDEQFRAARAEPADIFVGHNPQSLPIVARAARAAGARYAFDAEDLHSGQFQSGRETTVESKLVRFLEARYLPDCAYVSAASPGIARALAERYSIPEPATILNVFPWTDRDGIDGRRVDRRGSADGVSFYWYSQVISVDRGLQDAIAALAQVPAPASLHLRGDIGSADRAVLDGVARQHGVRERVHFHKPVAPEALLSRAAEHDIGLALERPDTDNRDLCITNKIFLYMLAGLGVIASHTTGQAWLMAQCAGAGELYRPGDVDALAAIMRRLASAPDDVRKMRAASLEGARARWNWEREKGVLVATVEASLQRATSGRLVRA